MHKVQCWTVYLVSKKKGRLHGAVLTWKLEYGCVLAEPQDHAGINVVRIVESIELHELPGRDPKPLGNDRQIIAPLHEIGA